MRKILFFYVLFFCKSFTCIAQVPSKLEQRFYDLNKYHEQYPKEKVYLHLDRTYYASGDDIWFKSYVTIGNFNVLSQFSKLIYVELIGPDSKLIQSLRLSLSAGICFGDFSIPDDVPSGEYKVRAYTQWMRNFDEGYFFEKKIVILNPQVPEKQTRASSKKSANNFNQSESEDSGFTIDLSYRSDAALKAIITAKQDQIKDQEVNLIVQNQGEVFYAIKAKISKRESVFTIPVENLGDGINEIALFSVDMKPLAFRKYFNFPPSLDIQLAFNKIDFKTREKVNVEMNVAGQDGKSKIGTFSVSITHEAKAPWSEEMQGNIKSYLLLKSYMKEELVSPLSYFSETGFNGKEKVNNLVANWGKDAAWDGYSKNKIQYPVEKSLKISGAVTTLGGKKEPNAKVILYSNDSGGILLDTIADENGRFVFDEVLFYDSTKFVVQARTEKGKKHLKIKLDTLGRQQISKMNDHTLSIRSQKDEDAFVENNKDRLAQQLNRLQKGIVLSDVVVEGKKSKVSHSANLNGAGNADQVITEEQLSNCSTLEMCLQGLVRGVIFRNGVPYSTRSPNSPMTIVVDGMEMEAEFFSSISSMDVESVEVLRSGGYLTLYGSSGGVLVITTKRGTIRSNASITSPGVTTYSPQGFSKIREFYSPDYSTNTEDNKKPDFRTTIYWNPNLVTDQNGKSSFEFYTSDQPGIYRIVIEGIDLDGRLGYIVKEIEVN